MTADKERCENCKFIHVITSRNMIKSEKCVRFPPVADSRGVSFYPDLRTPNWCGEFKLKER